MARAVAVLALVATLAAPAGGAATAPSFAFGRTGGNIIPFTVTISAGGRVQASGPVQAGRTTLTKAQLATLVLVASQVRFSALPAATMCTGTLPDVATSFVRVGTHTVRVHGDCVARFTRMWIALGAAVKLSY